MCDDVTCKLCDCGVESFGVGPQRTATAGFVQIVGSAHDKKLLFRLGHLIYSGCGAGFLPPQSPDVESGYPELAAGHIGTGMTGSHGVANHEMIVQSLAVSHVILQSIQRYFGEDTKLNRKEFTTARAMVEPSI